MNMYIHRFFYSTAQPHCLRMANPRRNKRKERRNSKPSLCPLGKRLLVTTETWLGIVSGPIIEIGMQKAGFDRI